MKPLRLIVLCCCLPAFSCRAQIAFFKAYSDAGYDVGEGIVQLPDSSYLLTGSTSSVLDHSQAFITQADSMGNRLWTKTYGGNESDRGRRIFYVENDGIYVAGQSNSFGSSFHDVYFFKTDPAGNLIYEKTYGSGSYDNVLDAVMLKDTSFILAGETYNTVNELENIYLLRIDKNGDTLWTKNLGTEGRDFARGISLLNDTTVIIAGAYYVADSLTEKAMLMRLHINGSLTWIKTYGNFGKYCFNDLAIENNIIRAVGENQSDLGLSGNKDTYMLRCDPDGNADIQYSEVHDGSFCYEHIVHYGSGTENYLFGARVSNSSDVSTYSEGDDLLIYKFHEGMYYNGASFNPSNIGNDIANQMIATSDGGAIAIGWNENPLNGGSNLILVKIGPNEYFPYSHTLPDFESLVELEEKAGPVFQVYPNPVKTLIFLPASFSGEETVIYNALGQKVLSALFSGEMNVASLDPGIYYLKTGQNEHMFRFVKE